MSSYVTVGSLPLLDINEFLLLARYGDTVLDDELDLKSCSASFSVNMTSPSNCNSNLPRSIITLAMCQLPSVMKPLAGVATVSLSDPSKLLAIFKWPFSKPKPKNLLRSCSLQMSRPSGSIVEKFNEICKASRGRIYMDGPLRLSFMGMRGGGKIK